MTDFKQCDPRWATLKYDGVNTYCRYGCFVTVLADLLDILPTQVAEILRNNGLFTDGYINDIARAGELLGLEYNGKTTTKPDYDTIAWTDYYDNHATRAIEKHFFIVRKDSSILDPLDKAIYYPIKEFYLFKKKDDMTWYQIGDKIFNNDVYIGDPNIVPWGEVKKLSPQGYQLDPLGTPLIKEVIKEVPVEKIVEKIVEVPAKITKEQEQEIIDQYLIANPPICPVEPPRKSFIARVIDYILMKLTRRR